MKVVIDIELIKKLIKEVRYRVKKHKDKKRRRRERKHAQKEKDKQNKNAKLKYVDQGTQTEEILYELY